MTKNELVKAICQETGIDPKSALAVVESLMETIKEALSNEDNVYLRGFGSFVRKKRQAKTARNIGKNTTIIIPEHYIPSFKPCKEFVKRVSDVE